MSPPKKIDRKKLTFLDAVSLRRLTKTNEEIAKAEDALLNARQAQLEEIQHLLDEGWTQAVIARALGIKRATLNQKIKTAGLESNPSVRSINKRRRQRRASKASTP